jgi:Cft2 family RNA processing exonuclease
VLLTHAHFDHSGALPVFHQQYPTTPVYMTPPTQALVSVLLQDALRIAQSRFDTDGDLPAFPAAAVEALMTRIIPVRFAEPMPIGTTALTATWFPAGHILGAASIGIEGNDHGTTVRVLFSGDLAVGDQLTVPGMPVPTAFRQPDVLVIESTYGNRLHSPRRAEEQRLVQLVSGVLARQGKLLIPAFAIGRAQEIALMLIRAIRQQHLTPFPVFLDGMVRSVCRIYTAFPAYQTAFCQRLTAQYGNPFIGVVDEVRMVGDPHERENILSGPPCAIIASSGMLSGGASADYAPVIAQSDRNAIAITGYQDEESPGRRLLALAEGHGDTLTIGGRTVSVRCEVTTYALSAHADADELTRLIDAVNPRQVVLVHGDGAARPALADRLYRSANQYRKVHLPRTGDTLQFGSRARAPRPTSPAPQVRLGQGQALEATTLPLLVEHLRTLARPYPYSPAELLDLWYGPQGWNEAQFTALVALLDTGKRGLHKHPRRPHLYQVANPPGQSQSAASAAPPPLTQQDMEARVTECLGAPPDLYHVGFHLGMRQVRLRFAFPQVAAQRYRDQFAQIVAGTAWTLHLNTAAHQERLAEVAGALLPTDYALRKPPALHMEHQTVTLSLEPTPPPDLVAALSAAFCERTGFTLLCQGAATAPSQAPAAAPEPPPTPQSGMEINAAFRTIDAAFAHLPDTARPYRKSLKVSPTGPAIELAFLTPEVGQQHEALLRQLSAATRYPLTVKPEPNQHALIVYLHAVVPPHWRLQHTPGIVPTQKELRITCANPPRRGSSDYLLIAERIRRDTGWALTVEYKREKRTGA